ncbi:HAD-IA family hydrolase [Falsochrobactrum sp. TDYN1]|uniref:HAD-IA family hydrolase n=1 Tax=Falsochrobactrum tianjinense TaxID=2706015 RepID=A0A949PMA9_9HYPH|nr:HAD-IA family hydrolase [Falsochrobactrum sp. TDYN1]MBV2143014.1 HAD-IA family hydrolase [Falsochrobactrum sp. TDYN1]
MTQYSALIFDLDGTLIDSAPDIAAAVNVYMKDHGWRELDVAYVEKFIGNGPRRLLLDIFIDQGLPSDDATVDAAVKSYIENYHRNPAEKTRFFDHVREDLEGLHKAGFRLGICTNKPHALTQEILKLLKLDHIFDVALGADAVPACKPDPGHLLAVVEQMGLEAKSWAYIGDTNVDRATAKGADATFFVVPWGGGAEVDVEPHQRLTRISDLMNYRPGADDEVAKERIA